MGIHHRCGFAGFFLLAVTWPAAQAQSSDGAEWLPRLDDASLRVLVWNVSREDFFRHAEGFRRVLALIDADLLLLDEMPGGSDPALISAELPAGEPKWNVLYGASGGMHQRASVAARFELQRVAAFEALQYPPALAAEWRRRAPRSQHAKFDDTIGGGISAVGTLFERDGRRVLAVGLDLQCCGDDAQSWENARRSHEATAVRQAIDATLADGGIDAVIVGGDFNLVTGPAPLDAMRGAGSAMELQVVDVPHRDGQQRWTWNGQGTPFSNGRLDYVLHSARLRVVHAQVFDSEGLSADEQQRFGMPAGLSQSLSAHRPLVVDFVFVGAGDGGSEPAAGERGP